MAVTLIATRTHHGVGNVISGHNFNYNGGYYCSQNCAVQLQFTTGAMLVQAQLVDATFLANFFGYNLGGGLVMDPDHTAAAQLVVAASGYIVTYSGNTYADTDGSGNPRAQKLVEATSQALDVSIDTEVYYNDVTLQYTETMVSATITFCGMTASVTTGGAGSPGNMWNGIAAFRAVGPCSTFDGGTTVLTDIAKINWKGPSDPSLREKKLTPGVLNLSGPLPYTLGEVSGVQWDFGSGAGLRNFNWNVSSAVADGNTVQEATGIISPISYQANNPGNYAQKSSFVTCKGYQNSSRIWVEKNGRDISTKCVVSTNQTNVNDAVVPLSLTPITAAPSDYAKTVTGTDGGGHNIYTVDIVGFIDGPVGLFISQQYPNQLPYTFGQITQATSSNLTDHTPSPPPPTNISLAACIHDRQARFYTAYDTASGIRVARADFPTPPFTQDILATTGITDHSPALEQDSKQIVRLLFVRGSDVLEITSTDFGKTWSSPVTMFTGATHPRARHHPKSGMLVRIAYRSGQLVGTQQQNPFGTISSEFTLVNDAGTAISVADDSFDFSPAQSYDEHLWSLIIVSGGAVQAYYSTDNCKTWKLNT